MLSLRPYARGSPPRRWGRGLGERKQPRGGWRDRMTTSWRLMAEARKYARTAGAHRLWSMLAADDEAAPRRHRALRRMSATYDRAGKYFFARITGGCRSGLLGPRAAAPDRRSRLRDGRLLEGSSPPDGAELTASIRRGMMRWRAPFAGSAGPLEVARRPLPLADASVDVVTTTMSFHHWTPGRRSARWSGARTGGRLLLADVARIGFFAACCDRPGGSWQRLSQRAGDDGAAARCGIQACGAGAVLPGYPSTWSRPALDSPKVLRGVRRE